MKVAIPVEKNDMLSDVSAVFGRAPYFLLYNTESKEKEFITNSAINSTGGAGIKAAQIIIDNNVDALLTAKLGENAANVLKAADVALYQLSGTSLEDNLKALDSEQLVLLSEVHKGFHNHGK